MLRNEKQKYILKFIINDLNILNNEFQELTLLDLVNNNIFYEPFPI